MTFTRIVLVLTIAAFTWSCDRASPPPPSTATIAPAAVTATPPPEDAVVLNFRVTGMHCNGCANALKSKLAKIEGVYACDASHSEKFATVTASDAEVADRVFALFAELEYEGELLSDASPAEEDEELAAEPSAAE